MILTNELPRFSDSSGALASRFVMSILTDVFYGRENPALTAELLEEAPGIFNWALDGLDRLLERGLLRHADVGAQRHSAIWRISPRRSAPSFATCARSARRSRSRRTCSGMPGRTGAPTRAATDRARRRCSRAT